MSKNFIPYGKHEITKSDIDCVTKILKNDQGKIYFMLIKHER